MHIKRIRKKNSYYLAQYESFRENGKVKTKFVKYLGKEGDEKRVPLPKKSAHVQVPLYPEISKRAGDIKLMWSIAEKELNLLRIINRICCGDENIEGKSPGKILTAWIVNKALNPESASNLSEWVKTTVIPDLSELPDDYFTDSAFYSALDRVCYKDNTADGFTDLSHLICEDILKYWRTHHPLPEETSEILAYDLTPILIFGNGDDYGEKGYNSKKTNKKQINLCVLVSKWDKVPISYFILPGNFNSMSSVKDLLVDLINLQYKPGTLIWDRGNTSEDSIKDIEKLGWKLICGVQKVPEDALKCIEQTEVQTTVANRVKSTEKSALYAKRVKGELFDRQDAGVVYINMIKRMELIDARNELLSNIGTELTQFNNNLEDLTEKEISDKISEIVGPNMDFFKIQVKKINGEFALEWEYQEAEINRAIAFDGKYLLYTTDVSRSAHDVVTEYVEKDFVEKTFRTLKSSLKIAPVRHWRNHRIRGIFFVNMMALWLRKAYHYNLYKIKEKRRKYGFEELLKRLKRVSYVEVISESGEKAYWYLNLNDGLVEQLRLMGFKDLFVEKRIHQM